MVKRLVVFFALAAAVFAACGGLDGLTGGGGGDDDAPAVTLLEAYALQNEVAPGGRVEIAARASHGVAAEWQAARVGWGEPRVYARGSAAVGPRDEPAPDPKTGLVEAGWPPSFVVRVGEAWPAGAYIVTLFAGGRRTHAIFVVNDGRRHDFVVQLSLSTYAAYNTWGGLSLYTNNTGSALERATRVSLDRPFLNNGLGDFDKYERSFIEWLERAGYDVGYTTNLGVDAAGDTLAARGGMFVMLGHDEYWSEGQRRAVDAAVAQGMHLSSFAGNSAYWRINYLPAADGRPRRVIECHRVGDEADRTQTKLWRAYSPEGELLGGQFGYILDSWAPLVVTDNTHPVFAGTDIAPGDQFPGLVGGEADAYYAPAGGVEIGRAPLIDYHERLGTSSMVLRTTASGAQVFTAGTLRWGQGLAGRYGSWRLQKLTANILAKAGSPTITPYYLPEDRLPEVHRWVESEVETVAANAGEPRSIVRLGDRILFVAAREREVRELHGDGRITTYLENTPAIVGLAADAAGNLWATDLVTHGVWRSQGGKPFERVSAVGSGYVDGPLAGAKFLNPTQITTDGRRFLVVEHRRDESRLRAIEDGVVRTLPLGEQVAFTGVPVENGGYLLGLADNRLWRLQGGEWSLVSGTTGGWHDANGKSARFLTPYWIAPNASGYYVVERYGHRIRFVSAAGGAWTIAGAGIGTRDGRGDLARFTIPYAVLEERPGVLLVTDAGNDAIRRITVPKLPVE